MEKTKWKDIAVVFVIWTVVITVALVDFDKLGGYL
jgi:hypothetical protein|tara:strand:- start:436 stop:540 length:105 start_codon:yes stop_codon:yes gene_type:complete